jgi:hypothetical protein
MHILSIENPLPFFSFFAHGVSHKDLIDDKFTIACNLRGRSLIQTPAAYVSRPATGALSFHTLTSAMPVQSKRLVAVFFHAPLISLRMTL